ncbi:hypothetical protein FXW07_16840 [Methanosarcina sp. DH1]|uniref:hypothetical protein n=1 Tax=Methanosarcina sp. DH1 TaxID=2605695 RepID=UPI001E5127E3|nr:hypothetical protein [Methanosarcina sp. DH1]MCC4768219.1 hypothetical protein [Methanosarcina sp. DH1]
MEKIWEFEGTLAYLSSLISSGLMPVKPALFLKLQVPFFTPRYEKRKWKYYYIFSVVGNPFNLKRIDSVPKSSDKSKCNITTQNYNSIIM